MISLFPHDPLCRYHCYLACTKPCFKIVIAGFSFLSPTIICEFWLQPNGQRSSISKRIQKQARILIGEWAWEINSPKILPVMPFLLHKNIISFKENLCTHNADCHMTSLGDAECSFNAADFYHHHMPFRDASRICRGGCKQRE